MFIRLGNNLFCWHVKKTMHFSHFSICCYSWGWFNQCALYTIGYRPGTPVASSTTSGDRWIPFILKHFLECRVIILSLCLYCSRFIFLNNNKTLVSDGANLADLSLSAVTQKFYASNHVTHDICDKRKKWAFR